MNKTHADWAAEMEIAAGECIAWAEYEHTPRETAGHWTGVAHRLAMVAAWHRTMAERASS